MWESFADVYTILRVVAVLFGVVVGAFAGRVLAPFVGNRRVGASLVVVCAALGGLALWLAVSRVGGKGGAGGEGNGPGDGASKSAGQAEPGQADSDRAQEDQTPTLKITMLGGDRVKDQRFYRVDHDQPLNWDELMSAIATRRRQNPGLKGIEILIFKNSVDSNNPAVRELEDWGKEQQLTVKVVQTTQRLPEK